MSAWMVNKVHIDLLVQVALEGPPGSAGSRNPWRPFRYSTVPNRVLHTLELRRIEEVCRTVDPDGAEALGQMLAAQNAASVRARYHDADEAGMIPAWADVGYQYSRPQGCELTVVELLKGINCYEYQSSETDGWPDSEAFQFCDTLRHLLISYLPGYDEAPWGWDPEVIKERR